MALLTPVERYEADAIWARFVDGLVVVFRAYEAGELRPPWEIEDACALAAHQLDPRRWPEPG